MEVAAGHTGFCLAIMILDRAEVPAGNPVHHFRVQRFTRTAAHPQPQILPFRQDLIVGLQQPIRRGRRRQVGDLVLADHVVGGFRGERVGVEMRGVAHQQRARNGVVQTIGPAGVSHIPEHIVVAQFNGVLHVHIEGQQGFGGHGHAFRFADSTGGEHLQERIAAGDHHRLTLV